MRLLLLLVLATGLFAQGDVLLVKGKGEACPTRTLGAGALVLRLDRATSPGLLEELPHLDVSQPLSRDQLARVRAASHLHLVGGDALAWWKCLEQRGKRSALRKSLDVARRRDATLVGWNSAAEYLCGGCIVTTAELTAAGFPPKNPRRAERERQTIGCLGFLPSGVVRLGATPSDVNAVVEALVRRQTRLALILDGELVWEYRVHEKRVEIHGTGRAILVEANQVRRTDSGIEEAKISRLQAGDLWDLEVDELILKDGSENQGSSEGLTLREAVRSQDSVQRSRIRILEAPR